MSIEAICFAGLVTLSLPTSKDLSPDVFTHVKRSSRRLRTVGFESGA